MTEFGVICGDRWHPAHVVLSGLQAAVPSGTKLDTLTEPNTLTKDWLAKKAVIVLAKINHTSTEDASPWLTSLAKDMLMDYVYRGGGLAVLHAGTVGYKADPTFCRFIGGVFSYHPESCRVTLAIHPSAAPFPVVASSDIVIHDEHYMMDMAEESLHVFMTSASEHGMQAAGWTKRHGEGRICTLTPGHFPEVWQHPAYRDLLSQALLWCSGEPEMKEEQLV